jgi:ligand-binding SRPBCC domain-containing protein
VKTWCLRASLWVPHPPEAVFPFFADARNLEALTPPWLSFRILTPMPVDLQVGARIDYRIKLHGLPLRWRTRIARWEPPYAFADEQLRGPYVLWHHTHTFTPCDGGTVLGDEVIMRPKGGPLAPLIMKWFVQRDVGRIFRYRADVMSEQFGGDRHRAQVQWVEAGHAAAPTDGATARPAVKAARHDAR